MSKKPAQLLKAARVALGEGRGLWAGAILLALAAFAVWADKPGLRARYVSHLDERPVLTRTDEWLTIDSEFASNVFYFDHLFRVEWRGWIDIERPGEHRFRVTASGPVRLVIDGNEVLATDGERRRNLARVSLEPGPRQIEIRFDHTGGELTFAAELREPRGTWAALPVDRLFDRRPSPVRRLIRHGCRDLGPVARKLVACGLLLLALFAGYHAAGGAAGGGWAPPPRVAAWIAAAGRRRWLAGAGLATLFAVATLAILPRVGSPFGWDDVRYLDIAMFDKNVTWVLNRYAHVYLLDFFIWLSRGDAFLGARIFWSAQFGLIVCALAVCAAQLGARLQLATFLVSLFLLFCQPLFFLRAGASVPDTTVGTLVLIAVALYLHRWRHGPSRLEWQILTIGAITVWAFKSKELGIILLWLVVLFVFERGELDWRGLARKVAFWLAGAAAGLALLMALDAVYFGDPLYGLRPHHLKAVGEFNMASDPQEERETRGWMDVVREGRTPVAGNNPRMRHMALLVIVAAFLAGWKRRSIELRLLHLMPVLYLLMLMLIHVRATYVFLVRYLYPVVPLSCFLAAAAFHYLELDDLEWREVRLPRFFVPALALGFLVVAIVIPYQTHWIAAEDFLPAEWLASIDWRSLDVFVRLVAAPALVLTLVLALVLFQHHRSTRLLLAATLVLLFLGLPFFRTVWELRTRRPWQRGESTLHGLRVLAHEIPTRPGVWVEVFLDPADRDRMFGPRVTCERTVAAFLGRRDVRVTCWPALTAEQDVAFLSRRHYDAWLESWPELERTAVFSPAGEVVLVRPREAGPPRTAAP